MTCIFTYELYTSQIICHGTLASVPLKALLSGPESVPLLPATIIRPFIKRDRWWNNIKTSAKFGSQGNLEGTGGKLEVQGKCATKGIKYEISERARSGLSDGYARSLRTAKGFSWYPRYPRRGTID